MALNSYPFENANTTEDQYTLLFRNFADSGIVGNYADEQFLVTTDGSGLDAQVAAGYAILRGHAVQNDGPITATFEAADTSFARLDRVVLRLDPVLDGITLVVIKGTPGSVPVAPPITRTNTGVWDLPLATVRVNANALNVFPDDIADNRTWGSHRFGVWSSSTRPESPRIGQPGFNIDINGAEVWSGTKWESVVTKRKLVVPHTFTLAGPVVTANSAGDYFVPPFFMSAPTGQTAKIVSYRARVWHGVVGTNTVTWKLVKNGSTDVSSVVSTTHHTGEVSGSLDSTFANGESLGLVVTGTVGSPKNLTVTVYVEYEA